jgi:hypothetical protein
MQPREEDAEEPTQQQSEVVRTRRTMHLHSGAEHGAAASAMTRKQICSVVKADERAHGWFGEIEYELSEKTLGAIELSPIVFRFQPVR